MEYFWFIVIVIIGAFLVLILVHLFVDLFGGPMQIMTKNALNDQPQTDQKGGDAERFLIASGLEEIFLNVLEAFKHKNIEKLKQYVSFNLLSSIELNCIKVPSSFFVFNRKIAWLSDTSLEVEFFGTDNHGNSLSEKIILTRINNKYMIDYIESLENIRLPKC